MQGWVAKNKVKAGLAPIGASVTNQDISEVESLSSGGASEALVVAISCSNVTAGAGITAKLQSGLDGAFVDSKSVSITGNGVFFIKLLAVNSSDQTYLPLLPAAKVVISTGAGSAVTVDKVNFIQQT